MFKSKTSRLFNCMGSQLLASLRMEKMSTSGWQPLEPVLFAPLIGESIPRLELMAALTLANLRKAVHEALTCTMKIDAVFNWTDSQIVWWWINREFKQFKLFVQNRVQKIRSLWSKGHWRCCPSDVQSC